MAIICTVLHICNTPSSHSLFLYITLLEYRIVHLWCFALEDIKKKKKKEEKKIRIKKRKRQTATGASVRCESCTTEKCMSSHAWCGTCCLIYLLCRVYKRVFFFRSCFFSFLNLFFVCFFLYTVPLTGSPCCSQCLAR